MIGRWNVRRMLGTAALCALAAPFAPLDGASAAPACGTGTVSVERVSGPVLYLETGTSPALDSAYAMYRITNTGTAALGDVWVQLGSFGGPSIGLAGTESGRAHPGALAAGAAANAAFYLRAAAVTAAPESHVVSVYATRPDLAADALCTKSFSMTATDDIAAAANKVTSVSTSGTPQLGGNLTITVVGNTGTIGAAGQLTATPASYATWPANAYRLTGSRITMSGGNSGVFTDTLFFSGLNTSATAYTAEFTFTVVGTAPATSVSPMTHISSGTQVKHTSTSNYGTLPQIPAVVNSTTLGLSGSPTALPATGGTVRYTTTVTNGGTAPSTLDDLVVTLPAGTGYVPGSATFGGSPIGDPTINAGAATFLSGLTVPAGGSRTLTIDVSVPGTAGDYTASVIGHVAAVTIDTTAGTGDAEPAAARVVVAAPPPTVTAVSPPTGPSTGGTAVTITGTNFVGVAAVAFGGQPATGYTVVSPTSITATSPAGTGTVQVTVTTVGGVSTPTGGSGFGYVGPPAAPAPTDLSSSGVGTATQSVTVPVPTGGTLRLVRAGQPVTEYTVAGEGGYAVTGAGLTFTPELGFAGAAQPATYRVTDAYGQSGDATYRPTVTLPAPPTVGDLTSSGVSPAVQTVVVAVPTGGTLRLLAGGAPTSGPLTVPGQGSYATAGPDTLTFTPEAGFVGAADPARFRVTDAYGQDAEATYRPTVTPPAPPTPGDLTSTGVGTAAQSAPVAVPAGWTLRLVHGGAPVTSYALPGTGTYAAGSTGLTFTPELGFLGAAQPATYRITDPYGQAREAVYRPTVTAPPPPAPADLASTGVGTEVQSVTVPVPAGGTLRLVHAGTTVTSYAVAGQGEYGVEAGGLSFRPVADHVGAADPATFRLTDAYGQVGDAVYRPTVTAPTAPAPTDLTSTGVGTEVQSVTVALPAGWTLRLLAAGDPVTAYTVAGAGTYRVAATGLTFTPELGFAGSPDAARFRITDPLGHTAEADYRPTVVAPPAPAPAPVASTGVGNEEQAVPVPLPTGGSLRLIAEGAPVDGYTVAGTGTFAVTPAGLAFSPELGFAGTAAPATYRVTDAYGHSGDATYQPTVTVPPPPAAVERASRGVGTTPQSAVLPVPAGGTIALLGPDGSEVTTFRLPGKGVYRLRLVPAPVPARATATGAGQVERQAALVDTPATDGAVVTFVAVPGYAGTAPPVEYRVTDAYGQTAVGTYTPTVNPPPSPTAPAQATTGGPSDTQQVILPVPAGGSVTLLDAQGRPVTTVTIPGQGTYTLDPATGRLTFTPVDGFHGTPDPVTYRITDAYGQAATATYAPAVLAAGPPAARPPVTGLPVTGAPVQGVLVAGLLLLTTGTGLLLAGLAVHRPGPRRGRHRAPRRGLRPA